MRPPAVLRSVGAHHLIKIMKNDAPARIFNSLRERIRKAGCLVLMRRGDREQAAGAHHLIKIMKNDAPARSSTVCGSASEKQDVWF
jgi:hypothetical protein